MISKSKLVAITLLAMTGIASPAFASGLQTGTAADTYGWNSPQANRIGGYLTARQYERGAFPRGRLRR
jgi:hypothetical protein